MSHKISNLYASKIFGEHPLALWPLDDEVYFPSLLTVNQKDIESISVDHGTWESVSSSATAPKLSEESYSVLSRNDLLENLVTLEGPVVSASAFDPRKATVCNNIYAYSYNALVDYFEIGILYNLSASSSFYDYTIANSISIPAWQQLQFTSKVPESFINAQPIFKIKYIDGASLEDYDVLLNALSFGQNSEEFLYESTGDILQDLQDQSLIDILPNTSYKVLPMDPYGFDDSDLGYYIIDNNSPLAKNTSLPMVYGAGNITHIEPSVTEGMPGIVIPGKGFLNNSGRYQNKTLEFWLRTYSDMHEEFRVVGPVSSTDGLYINEELMTLKIGKNKKSYFVGKWFRPMLVDIKYSYLYASVLINGKEVINMDLDQDYISFPDQEEDWIGFYGHSDLHPFDLDCIAIFPYLVPEENAKRRYVYGQGVNPAENIINNFDGNSYYIDFPFANYSANLNYPENANWNGGYFNNIDANSKFISLPAYEIPELITTTDLGDLDIYADNYSIQSGSATFFSLSPSANYSSINSYLHFDTVAKIGSSPTSVFGMFKNTENVINDKQTLMYFYNNFNSNTFEIALNGSSIQYLYNNTLQHSASVDTSEYFVVGINMETISINLQNVLGNFFSNPQNLQLNVGGNGTNTFKGQIHNVTINNKFFTDKDNSLWFNSNGFINYNLNSNIDKLQYTGCYSLRPTKSSPVVYLDVAVAGYWEDSIPLSYFGKLVQNKSGDQYYDLDMIQFNIDYSSNPVISIPQHDNHGLSNHILKSYMTIQHFTQVGKTPYRSYTNVNESLNYRIVDFDNSLDVITTKFEIVDGTSIFPPKELVSFEDYYITIHLELKSPGINTAPVELSDMSLCSIAHSDSEFFGIGTRTGNQIYPIVKSGDVYLHKYKNPIRIYKDSTPYLYLTGDSGISCLADSTPELSKGFSFPINNQRASQYILGGMQMWMMYNKGEYISETIKIGRLITPDKTLDFYIVPEFNGNAKRGFLKVFDGESGYEDFTIDFYQNGIQIQNPVIYPLMWSSIVISFGESIALNAISGQMEFYGGAVYNNIAYFKRSSLVLGQSISERTWQQVKTTEAIINNEIQDIDLHWQDWYNSFWLDLLEKRTILTYIIDGELIFGSFLGISNSTISDESLLQIESEGADVFTGIDWELFFGRPV